MRKISIVAGCLSAALLVGGVAFAAAPQSSSSSGTQTAQHKNQMSKQQADQVQMQKQLNQLKQQLNQLNQQLASDNQSLNASSQPAPKASDWSFLKGHLALDNPVAGYFEMFPKGAFPLDLLLSKPYYADQSLVFGGYMESDLQYWNLQNINNAPKRGTQFGVTSVDLDVLANLNSWVQAFVSYQGSNLIGGPNGTANQTIAFQKGFVTIGNLQQAPVYLTVGKTLMPLGAQFVGGGNGPWVNALPKTYVLPAEMDQAILGFYQNGLSAAVSVFEDDQNLDHHRLNFALGLSYTKTINTDWNYVIGSAFINDVRGADSTLGYAFQSINGAAPSLYSNGINPLIDFNGALNYKIYGLTAEYDQTLKNNYSVATNQNTGIFRTWEVGATAAPQLSMLNNPTTFGVSYSGASGVNYISTGLPEDFNTGISAPGIKQAWVTYVSQPVFKNWFLSLEYGIQRTYDNQNANEVTIDSSLYF